jgi:rod shape determining protein RodA
MKRETWKHFDYLLFGTVVSLIIFGIAMIRSAIAGNENLTDLVNRQMIWAGVTIVVILVVGLVDYHYYAALSRPMYLATAILLAVIFAVGKVSFGAKRWLDTGFFFIQPAELAKIIMVLVLADFFARHRDDEKNLRWVFRSLILTASVVIWILLQPNLSNSIVIFVMWFALVWLAGLPTKYLLLFAVSAVVLGAIAFPFLEQYQQQRIVNFIVPDPNARHGNGYNVDQALVSIGSGGWFGQGYGHSSQVQLRFLQVRQTDYIFSAMSAEFGFIGDVLIVGLLVFVIIRCFRAAKLASDAYGAFIAYGFGVLIFFQTAVNIGVNLSVIPVTGLTLPFISYGGSSLLSLGLGIGLVESVVSRHKELDF